MKGLSRHGDTRRKWLNDKERAKRAGEGVVELLRARRQQEQSQDVVRTARPTEDGQNISRAWNGEGV